MNAQNPDITKAIEAAIAAPQPQIELVPADAPFDEAQRQWLNGLLTGLSAIAASAAQSAEDEAPLTEMRVLYGSQSGNCEVLSKDLKKHAATQGFDANVSVLDDITLAELAEMQHVTIIVSTFGEGEPPDNAAKFYSALMADDCPPLPASLNFSVCGLGDTSYADFNKCATDIDARLAELGATRISDFVACDVDFDDDYAAWKTGVFESEAFKSAASSTGTAPIIVDAEPVATFDKNRPFMASLIACEKLSGEGSSKCVNHIEISLAGGGEDLEYAAGDALGVWPVNCPDDVSALLNAAGLTGKETVALKSGPARLRAALSTQLDIATVTPKTLEALGLDEAPDGAQVFEIVCAAGPLEAQTLASALRPLQPRLYSISSSPKAHPGEVHLTVGEVRYALNDRDCKGVASCYLGDRLAAGGMVGVYVQKSSHFHPPADDNVPLIMIGPGTGIAPFRAFMEERSVRGAKGKNWLFFGDQHEASDYLYRDQIDEWAKNGLLTELSLAWSRDGTEKVYVQTLMETRGDEVFSWLQEGAAVYVCGDASRMAADVEQALLNIIAKGLGGNEAAAVNYLDAMSAGHRYQRDVY
ncbi:MAG: flavodoxin domain-containing protein [Pseudomonadota bacterium]